MNKNQLTKLTHFSTITVLFLISSLCNSQNKKCRTDILNGIKVERNNQLTQFLSYDFSNSLLSKNPTFSYGIIGEEHERLGVELLLIEKNRDNEYEYFVFGYSIVKDNRCDFIGKITLTEVHLFKGNNWGLDDEFKRKNIKNQGLLIGTYEFYENKKQQHVGFFKGRLQSKFYISENEQIVYNDINLHSDNYFNNSFVGQWKSYNSQQEKTANWADFRVPNSNCDFDIGTGEFKVSTKYLPKGWFLESF